MSRYFFTFGSDPDYPFYRGWIEIQAKDKHQAVDVFRAYFPDKTDGIVNCAFIYSEKEFVNTDMYQGKLPEEHCHGVIGITTPKYHRKDWTRYKKFDDGWIIAFYCENCGNAEPHIPEICPRCKSRVLRV